MVQIPAARLICNSKNRVNYSGNCKTGEGNLSNDKSSRNSCPPFRTKRFRFRNFISLALFTDRSELFSRRFNFNSNLRKIMQRVAYLLLFLSHREYQIRSSPRRESENRWKMWRWREGMCVYTVWRRASRGKTLHLHVDRGKSDS